MELLEAMEIGDPIKRDCMVHELQSNVPILKRLEKININLDELDYLIERLDSFCDQEIMQFQGAAVKFNIYDMTDLINLTFCCQQVTVISDFSDLDAVGRSHFLTMEHGSTAFSKLEQINGRDLAMALISYEEGTITPYGVVYDNGMQMEQLYDGQYLPCSKLQVERGMLRSGIENTGEMCF